MVLVSPNPPGMWDLQPHAVSGRTGTVWLKLRNVGCRPPDPHRGHRATPAQSSCEDRVSLEAEVTGLYAPSPLTGVVLPVVVTQGGPAPRGHRAWSWGRLWLSGPGKGVGCQGCCSISCSAHWERPWLSPLLPGSFSSLVGKWASCQPQGDLEQRSEMFPLF